MTLNRAQPALPPHAYRTFSVRSPIQTHTRPATCKEVECDAYRNGWRTTIDTAARLPGGFTGLDQADFIRSRSGRAFVESWVSATVVVFEFAPGQQGFSPAHDHRVSLNRPEWFFVRSGDWRIVPARHEIIQHTRARFWVEEFAENQQRLADIHNRG